MDESLFRARMRRAKGLSSDYGVGYQRGLHRLHFGEGYGEPGQHEKWMALGLAGDSREELGRGYRDGFAGEEPNPLRGRPPLPEGDGKTARVEWRTTAQRKEQAQRLATEAGLSLSQWLDDLVRRAASA